MSSLAADAGCVAVFLLGAVPFCDVGRHPGLRTVGVEAHSYGTVDSGQCQGGVARPGRTDIRASRG